MEFRRLPFRSSEKRFFVGSVDSFLGVIWRHVPTVCGSLLEAQSVHAQAPILPVGTLVPLPPLWHFNGAGILDRKSTRLNSSHGYISYAVFCLKKKNIKYLIALRTSQHTHFTSHTYILRV